MRHEKRETRKIYKGKHLNPFPTPTFSFFFFFLVPILMPGCETNLEISLVSSPGTGLRAGTEVIHEIKFKKFPRSLVKFKLQLLSSLRVTTFPFSFFLLLDAKPIEQLSSKNSRKREPLSVVQYPRTTNEERKQGQQGKSSIEDREKGEGSGGVVRFRRIDVALLVYSRVLGTVYALFNERLYLSSR